VPELEDLNVTQLTSEGEHFLITLETGETVCARNVVLAVGITWFAHMPDALTKLAPGRASHSSEHREVSQFKGKQVAVLGAGSSAIDLAYLLHQEGAEVHIVARTPVIHYNRVPDAADATLIGRTLRPASGIGRGWRSLFCAEAPLLFYRLPQSIKRRAIDSHMHPAAGWFMREKVEAQIPMLLGRTLVGAQDAQGRVKLTLDAGGKIESHLRDHVIAATGYRTDMRRIPFLSAELCGRIAPEGPHPVLSDSFETPVPGLFAVGTAAMEAFGPLMRFMVGAEFAAPRVAARLERRLGHTQEQRAA
jgi:thioredoxin reductase